MIILVLRLRKINFLNNISLVLTDCTRGDIVIKSLNLGRFTVDVVENLGVRAPT